MIISKERAMNILNRYNASVVGIVKYECKNELYAVIIDYDNQCQDHVKLVTSDDYNLFNNYITN